MASVVWAFRGLESAAQIFQSFFLLFFSIYLAPYEIRIVCGGNFLKCRIVLIVGEKRGESLDFSVGERGGRYGPF